MNPAVDPRPTADHRRIAWGLVLGTIPCRFLLVLRTEWLALLFGVRLEPWQARMAEAETDRRRHL